MDIAEAIREADVLLADEPVDQGRPDPRWQAILHVGEFVESDPEAVWGFIHRWGSDPQEDLRAYACRSPLGVQLRGNHSQDRQPLLEQPTSTAPN